MFAFKHLATLFMNNITSSRDETRLEIAYETMSQLGF
jgi:hypothetical protein